MNYISTRGNNQKMTSAQAIIAGLADDGGLFVPDELPQVDMGRFGKEIEKLSKRFIEAGQCACFASDAHDLPNRQYQYSEALQKLDEEFGKEKVEEFKNNARAIINERY